MGALGWGEGGFLFFVGSLLSPHPRGILLFWGGKGGRGGDPQLCPSPLEHRAPHQHLGEGEGEGKGGPGVLPPLTPHTPVLN